MTANRTRVQVRGTVGKSVRFPTGTGSSGATIGVDFRLPNGTIPTLQQLAAALTTGSALQDQPGNITPPGGGTPIIWQNIQAIPQYVIYPGRPVVSDDDGGEDYPRMAVPGPVGPRGLQGFSGVPADDAEDPVPGPPGAAGAAGIAGPPGVVSAVHLWPDDPEDNISIPGAQGPPGNNGTQGAPGVVSAVHLWPDDAEDPGLIPGAQGPPGNNGSQGAPGVISAVHLWPDDAEDPGLIPGAAGQAGATGAAGPPGVISAVHLWPDDTEDPSLIPGPQGAQGIQGPAGVGSSGAGNASMASWLDWDTMEEHPSWGPPSTPANPANSIQFNNGGAFGGSANLTWNGTEVSIAGGPQVLLMNSTNASGMYFTMQRSGTSLADIGNSAQVFSGGTLDNLGVGARAGFGLDLGAGGAKNLSISSAGYTGINCTPVSGVALRVQDVGGNDVGLEWQRSSATIGTILSYNRNLAAYTSLRYYAADHQWSVAGSVGMSFNANNQLVVSAPTTGAAVQATGLTGTGAFQATTGSFLQSSLTTVGLAMNSSGANYGQTFDVGAGVWALGYGTSASVPGTAALKWDSSGRVTIGAQSGQSLNVNGTANQWSSVTTGSSTTGQSYGAYVAGGTNASDIAFGVFNQSTAINFMRITGDGSGWLGPSSSLGLSWSTAGSVTHTVATGGNPALFTDGTVNSAIELGGATMQIGTITVHPVTIFTSNATRLTVSAAGVMTAPASPMQTATTTVMTGVASVAGAATTYTSNTTLSAVTGMSVTASELGTYEIDACFYYSEVTSSAGGFKMDLNGGTAVTTNVVLEVLNFITTAAPTAGGINSLSFSNQQPTVSLSTTTPSWTRVRGTLKVTTAGTITGRGAQSTSSANTTSVLAGSYLKLTKIG